MKTRLEHAKKGHIITSIKHGCVKNKTGDKTTCRTYGGIKSCIVLNVEYDKSENLTTLKLKII